MLYQPLKPPREPWIENHGIFAHHDQQCAVYTGEHAVLDLSQGVFYPSWKAQGDGWRLVRADTWWRRALCWLALRR